MVAKQLSIFLENKSGRLTEVTEVLAKEGINLSALCIAENADFGILRGIVSDPDKAYKALKDNHFAVNVTEVVGINFPDRKSTRLNSSHYQQSRMPSSA